MSDQGTKAKKGATQRREVNAGTQVSVGEASVDPNYVPRFKTRYREVVLPQLKEKFGYKNDLQVPRIEKIVLNIGAGEAAADQKKLQAAINDLTAIAGQKAVPRGRRRRSPASRSAKAWRSAPRSRCARTGCTNSSTA